MEKLIYQGLYVFLEYNNLIYYNEFGFRYNHSTEHALVALSQEIQDACDMGALTCRVSGFSKSIWFSKPWYTTS